MAMMRQHYEYGKDSATSDQAEPRRQGVSIYPKILVFFQKLSLNLISIQKEKNAVAGDRIHDLRIMGQALYLVGSAAI